MGDCKEKCCVENVKIGWVWGDVTACVYNHHRRLRIPKFIHLYHIYTHLVQLG